MELPEGEETGEEKGGKGGKEEEKKGAEKETKVKTGRCIGDRET